MSKTNDKLALVERAYSELIGELIAKAVAPPLEQFKQTAVTGFEQSAQSLAAAKNTLEQQSEQLRRGLELQVKSNLEPVCLAMEDVRLELKAIVGRLEAMNARVNNYREKIDRVEAGLNALEPSAASYLQEALAKALEQPLHGIRQATTSGLDASATAISQTRDEIEHLNEQVATELKSQAVTLSDSMNEVLGKTQTISSILEEANHRLSDHQVKMETVQHLLVALKSDAHIQSESLTHKLGQATESINEHTLNATSSLFVQFGKETEAHTSQLQNSIKGIGNEIPQIQFALSAIQKRLIEEQERTGIILGYLPSLQTDLESRTKSLTHEVAQLAERIQHKITGAQSELTSEIRVEIEAQTGRVLSSIKELCKQGQTIQTRLHAIQSALAEEERKVQALQKALADMHSLISSQLKKLESIIDQFRSRFEQRIKEIVADLTGLLVQEIASLKTESESSRLRLANRLESQSQALQFKVDTQHQSLRSENLQIKQQVNRLYIFLIIMTALLVIVLGLEIASAAGAFHK